MVRRADLTVEELDRIADLTEISGLGAARIAKEIGCSVGSVTWAQLRVGADRHPEKPLADVPTEPLVALRGGFPVRRFTQDEDEQLEALALKGRTDAEIARVLGRRANTVRGRLMTLARRAARKEAQSERLS